MNQNKRYILQHRRGFNFLRWLWLSTNLFVTVRFHDINKAIRMLPEGGGIVNLEPREYLLYDTLNINRVGVHIIGAR